MLNARLLVALAVAVSLSTDVGPQRAHSSEGYLHKHLEETQGTNSFRASRSFATLPLLTNRKEKEAARHSEAAALEYETFANGAFGGVRTQHIQLQDCQLRKRESGRAPDGSCMTLAHGGTHTVSFDHLERVRAINTSAAR